MSIASKIDAKIIEFVSPVQSVAIAKHYSPSLTDRILLLNARRPIGKPDGEDENMKVLRLLNDVKKLQKKWKTPKAKL
jgi:hypothetical protein